MSSAGERGNRRIREDSILAAPASCAEASLTPTAEGIRTAARIPDAWLPGVTSLCGITPHTHGVRGENGDWVQQDCPTPGKRPLLPDFNGIAARHWAETSPQLIDSQRAFALRTLAEGKNLGLVPPPGVMILDADTEATCAWLDEALLGGTPIMRRTDASAHYYVRMSPDLASRAKAKRIAWTDEGVEYAVDLRLPGKSQAVIPPSKHKSGTHYQWETPLPESLDEVPACPDAVEQLLLSFHTRRDAERPNREAMPGHDQLRRYVNRKCRFSRDAAEVRAAAELFAWQVVYVGRDARLAEILAPGGELDRLVNSGWERFGGAAPLEEDRTDEAYVSLFLAHHDQFAYEMESKRWLEKQADGVWSQTTAEAPRDGLGMLNLVLFEDAAREVADGQRRDRLAAMARGLRMNSKVTAVVRRIQDRVALSASAFDHVPYLLALPEGWILDTRDGSVVESKVHPEFKPTRVLGGSGFTVEATEEKVRWLQFLADTFGDPELIAFVHRAVGASLMGSSKPHALFFLFGRAGSGKSTFLMALRAAFGSYAEKFAFETFAGDVALNAAAPSPDLARLKGVRFAYCSEIADRARLGAKLKDLTGGEAITGRRLFGDLITFEPTHSVWVAGNVAPTADFLDSGVERRLMVIPADHVCERPDPRLGAKLATGAGLAAVLDWAIEGLLEVRERIEAGLDPLGAPEVVTAARREYWAALNPVDEWLQAAEVRGPGEVPATLAYQRFLEWMEATHGLKANNFAVPNSGRFGVALKRSGIGLRKGAKGARLYIGLNFAEKRVADSKVCHPSKLPDLQDN